jgi:hypothetical protein
MEGWQYKAAFVIQFRVDADIETGAFEGRIEHIASSRAIRFHSLEDMLAFIAAVLADMRAEEGNL